MIDVFALTTRGLESVSANELRRVMGADVTATTYRRVAATFDGDLNKLLTLRTVDDVYISLQTWDDIGRPRRTLMTFKERSSTLDLRDAAAACLEVRPLGTPPTFSVTASFVGKRNYTTEEIKLAVAEGIEASHGWEYFSDDAVADLNVRVFLEHEQAYLGVRLGQKALHLRPYMAAHVRGTPKPPIAAAMVQLAQAEPHAVLLDPCCSAGYIIIEAASRGFDVLGGDTRSEAVIATLANMASADVHAKIEQWDLAHLPLMSGTIPRIVTHLNPEYPEGAEDALAGWYATVLPELQRVLAPDGRMVLLTAAPQLATYPALQLVEQLEISLFGQTRFILVLAAPQ